MGLDVVPNLVKSLVGGSATDPRPGVPFARELARFGRRTALVTADGTAVTYTELADRVERARLRLGAERRLVLVGAANDLEPLVAYLAALAGGHPVLLAAPDGPRLGALVEAYDPDVVIAGSGRDRSWEERRPGTVHDLHPDLALLLSTSGSTGSPKLVRLSADNLQANAESIAQYLGIRDTDRAALSLPLHYCYGLSVVNSNLLRGAAVLLSDHSVADEEFWSLFRAHGGTSLHGVPYTFDLLDRIGFADLELPSLRYVTQAGGRLAPERVRRYAELGQRAGWRMFVMYGQTEATARMAYLPPELAAVRPDAVGIAVPGGRFELRPASGEPVPDGAAEPDEGELVYRGPNVMLGYAESPDDLALGRTVDHLATGDLARRAPDGLIEVIGRKSRFIKPFGLRVDLGQVERLLEGSGHSAVCTGDDLGLVVAVTRGEDARRVGELVQSHVGLPATAVTVCAVNEFPRLSTGKLDYAALIERARPAPGRGRRRRTGSETVRALFERVLGEPGVEGSDTFVGLGGDSLSYVQMSIELERLLGYVPEDWQVTPVAELEALERRGGLMATMETNIVLRAAAIVGVVGSHVGLFHILGGAHLLLVIAGWSFARFGLAGVDPDRTGVRILRSATRVAVPAMLWMLLRMPVTTDVGWTNVILVNNQLRTSSALGYWFVEVLVQILLVLGIVFAVPAVRRFERRHGFEFALGVLALALVGRAFIDDAAAFPERVMSTHGVAWFFVLGWAAHRAATSRQKLVVLALTLVLVPDFFGDPVRDAVVGVGLVVLLLVSRVPVPRLLVPVIGAIAGASLAIYLTHYAVYPSLVLATVPAALVAAVSLGVGVLVWLVLGWSGAALRSAVRGRSGSRGRSLSLRTKAPLL